MKYLHLFPGTLLMIFITSCKPSSFNKSLSTKDKTSISIYQNGAEKVIVPGQTSVDLKRDPFSIRFFNRAYNGEAQEFNSTQVAALLSKEELAMVKSGIRTENVPFFAPGSGMAPASSGAYDLLIFNNYGHHYLFYENENSKRVLLLKDYGEYKKLEFSISTLLIKGEEMSVESNDLDEFYLVIFTDRNLNKTIEAEELYKLILKFE